MLCLQMTQYENWKSTAYTDESVFLSIRYDSLCEIETIIEKSLARDGQVSKFREKTNWWQNLVRVSL